MSKRQVKENDQPVKTLRDTKGIGEKMRMAEQLGNDVNKILKAAHDKANKLLAPHGYKLANFKVDFCVLGDEDKSNKDNDLGQDLNQKVSPA